MLMRLRQQLSSLRERGIPEIIEEYFFHRVMYTVTLEMNINSWYLTF